MSIEHANNQRRYVRLGISEAQTTSRFQTKLGPTARKNNFHARFVHDQQGISTQMKKMLARFALNNGKFWDKLKIRFNNAALGRINIFKFNHYEFFRNADDSALDP